MAAGVEDAAKPLYTIGHGTAPIEDFIAQLRSAGVESVVDVRRFPGSRHNPQYGSASLERTLGKAGIAYGHDVDLGGRRRSSPDSPNTALRVEAFRAYADHMATSLFHTARDRLFEVSSHQPTAIMCSETLWWRCHRRLIADAAVLVGNRAVQHLMSGKQHPHVITDGARLVDDDVIYDVT